MTVSRKRSNEIITELETRFLDGEKLSTGQIVEEYFKASNTFNYLLAKETVKRYISRLKSRFQKVHGVWFGCLNEIGHYGICQTEAEYRYSLLRYFSFIKGNLNRAVRLRGEASEKGMLIGFRDMPFLLPAPVEKKEE